MKKYYSSVFTVLSVVVLLFAALFFTGPAAADTSQNAASPGAVFPDILFTSEKDNLYVTVFGKTDYLKKDLDPGEIIEICCEKEWNDGDDAASRPAEVTIHLLADGSIIETRKLSEAVEWRECFRVPKYSETTEIQYSITEELVPGYIPIYIIINQKITPTPTSTPTPTITPTPTSTPTSTLTPTPTIPENIVETDTPTPTSTIPVFYTMTPPPELPKTGISENVSQKPASVNYKPVYMELQIPALELKLNIVEIGLQNGVYPVEWLGNNVGVLENTSLPGEGISIIAGHNTLGAEEYGPFALLATMNTGDRLFVRTDENQIFVFEVYVNEKISENDVSGLMKSASRFENTVTLLTCEDELPEGGYANRRIVSAKMVE